MSTSAMQLPPNVDFNLLALPNVHAHNDVSAFVDAGGGYFFSTALPTDLPQHWRGLLGSLTADAIREAGSYLITTHPQAVTSDGPDGEPGFLRRRLFRFLIALHVSVDFLGHDESIYLSGYTTSADATVNGTTRYPKMWFTSGAPLGRLTDAKVRQAAKLAKAIEELETSHAWSRLRFVLSAFRRGCEGGYLDERLHQFVRCSEGFLNPDIRRAAAQFAHRAQQLTRSDYQRHYREIYIIRSSIEHVRGATARIPAATSEARQRILIERTIQAELLARFCLSTFLSTPALWPHFRDDAAIDGFWAADERTRRSQWPRQLDMAAFMRQLR